MTDSFYTIQHAGEGLYREKMSRFLAFAFPTANADESRLLIKEYQNKYHDARHVCWAYMHGPEGNDWQVNDNGEPSGTAGKPILGQMRSLGLTDVTVIVVRYFGGIKLGTSGLTAAYREAARMALEDGGRRECFQTEDMQVTFPYVCADGVMKIIKSMELEVISRHFDNLCGVSLRVRKSLADEVRGRISKVEGVSIEPKSV